MAVQTKQLRILSTILLAFAVGQAGLGSGFLDEGSRGLLVAHTTNAFAVVVLSVLAAVFGLTSRRDGGPGWIFFLPVALVIASVIQLSLGFAGIRGGHVFFGVLYLCAVTTYCSYTWRLLTTGSTASRAGAGTQSTAGGGSTAR